MMILITGGAASGKSALAESILQKMPGVRYYAATMHKAEDEETIQRISRHVKMREGKGFITIEQEVDLGKISVEENSSVMVECLSNLLANEMYLAGRTDAVSYITEQIRLLSKKCKNLILVTNEVSSDGVEYDDFTMEYIENMEMINGELAKQADYVIESVYSVPVSLKGNLKELKKEGFI